MRETGIPPHVHLYVQQNQTKDAVEKLPDILMKGFEDLLVQHSHNGGGVSALEVRQIMQSLLAEAGLAGSRAPAPIPTPAPHIVTTVQYWESDHKYHRLKEDFELPQVDARTAWRLWWFGNQGDECPPLRCVQPSDFATMKKRNTYSEWNVLMRHITTAYEAESGVKPMPRPWTADDADEWFSMALRKLPIAPSPNQSTGKPPRAVTFLKAICVANHKATPNARVVPFRKRKRAK